MWPTLPLSPPLFSVVQPHCLPMMLWSSWMYSRLKNNVKITESYLRRSVLKISRRARFYNDSATQMWTYTSKMSAAWFDFKDSRGRLPLYFKIYFLHQLHSVLFRIIDFIKFPPRSTASIYCVPSTVLSTGATTKFLEDMQTLSS